MHTESVFADVHGFCRDALREIKSGIAKLLLNARRENDGIAVHYSQSSLHAGTVYPQYPL